MFRYLAILVLCSSASAQFSNPWLVSGQNVSLRTGLNKVTVGFTVIVRLACDNATDNLARIQTALNTAQHVTLTGSGICLISGPILAISNTWLTLEPTVTLRTSATLNNNMLVNSGYNTIATTSSVTLTWTAGLTVSAAWTAHGLSTGDYVLISGANQSYYNGVFPVTVSDANTFTYVPLRLPTTGATGTTVGKKCDVNITVEGGIWDSNYPTNNGSTSVQKHAIIIGAAANVVVRNVNIINVSKFSLHFGAVRDVLTDQVVVRNASSDAIKVYGPATNVKLLNTSGLVADDAISFQSKEADAFSSYRWTFGDIVNGLADGVNAEQTVAGTALAMVYPSTNEIMSGISIKNVTGTTSVASGNCVGITSAFTGATIYDTLFENINCNAQNILTIGGAGTLAATNVELRHPVFNPNTVGASNPTAAVVVASTGTVSNLTVDGLAVSSTTYSTGAGLYLIIINGAVTQLNWKNSVVVATASSRGISLSATAVVSTVNVEHVTDLLCNTFIAAAASSTVGIINILDSNIGCYNTVSLASTNAVTVNIDRSRLADAFNGVIRTTGTVAATVTGAGNITASPNQVLTWYAVASGTPVTNLKSWNVSVDLSLTGLAKCNGCYATNTNAALGTLGTAGPVMADGTNWRRMSDPTLLY